MRKILTITILMVAMTAGPYLSAHAADGLPLAYLEWANKIQDGYSPDIFTKIDLTMHNRVEARNQAEQIVSGSYDAAEYTTYGTRFLGALQQDNMDYIKGVVAKINQENLSVAAAHGEFTYIPHSDGKIEYFKDGLVSTIVNERVVDELGNVNIKNSYNLRYNDKRLLIGSESDTKDILGNISHTVWTGTYTSDSVFYGTNETNANKNIESYRLLETDSAGNTQTIDWDSKGYNGKCVQAFSETINDSIYGTTSFTRSNFTYLGPTEAIAYHEEGIGTDNLSYSLDRSGISYNDKNQVLAYHEVLTTIQIDNNPSTTTIDAQLKYLPTANEFGPDTENPPDRLLETVLKSREQNADGSWRDETTTTTNAYDSTNKLIGASSISNFTGKEASWLEFKDAAGHILTQTTQDDGTKTYSYLDWDTGKTVNVAADAVTATLKDGNPYSGTQEVKFEALYGKLMNSEIHTLTSYYSPDNSLVTRTEDSTATYKNGLVNNLQRMLSSQENTKIAYPTSDPEDKHSETKNISTTYVYDLKGNLTDAYGTGSGQGYEYSQERGWAFPYISTFTEKYQVTLGKLLKTTTDEVKTYIQ